MNEKVTMTVKETARLLGVSPQCVRVGLESGALPIGAVVKMKRNVYIIYRSAVETLVGEGGMDERNGTRSEEALAEGKN